MGSHTNDGQLAAFLEQHIIPFSTRTSKDFDDLHCCYGGLYEFNRPYLITRPQTNEHVAQIVTRCVALDLPIVVRGCGHDMHGRFSALDAVSIDLRDLRSVVVSDDKTTARIGGGTTSQEVLEALQPHGLQAAVGTCAIVGLVGWSLVGGFGPYCHCYGLGADQIVGAKVVNAEGKLVEANEKMLKGLRGGGGALGIVVELTIKAHPEQEAGFLVYESSNLRSTIGTFMNNYRKLIEEHGPWPRELYIIPSIWSLPQLGCVQTCTFVWTGPEGDESRLWRDRAGALSTPLVDPATAIQTMSALDFMIATQEKYPERALGRCDATAVSSMTPAVIDALATVAEKLPTDTAAGIQIHVLRPECPSCGEEVPDSVLPYREPHITIEILGISPTEVTSGQAAAWALETRNTIMQLSEASKRSYLALTAPEFVDLNALYGDKLDDLLQLKREFDPTDVFKHSLPKLGFA